MSLLPPAAPFQEGVAILICPALGEGLEVRPPCSSLEREGVSVAGCHTLE